MCSHECRRMSATTKDEEKHTHTTAYTQPGHAVGSGRCDVGGGGGGPGVLALAFSLIITLNNLRSCEASGATVWIHLRARVCVCVFCMRVMCRMCTPTRRATTTTDRHRPTIAKCLRVYCFRRCARTYESTPFRRIIFLTANGTRLACWRQPNRLFGDVRLDNVHSRVSENVR